MSDTQARRFLLTINNPQDKDVTHDSIIKELSQLATVIYYCMSDEVGSEGTYHTHIFLACSSCLRFSTIKRHFPSAHIDRVMGTPAEAREYVLKIGKWLDNNDKRGTQVPNTQVEWGEPPQDRQGERVDIALLYQLIKDGLSNYEIMEQNPDYLLNLEKIERARYVVREQQYRDTFRKLKVAYVFGNTGTGKTRSIMDGFGYSGVYRVTDYKSHPFDSYAGENVLLLDEYNSGFRIQDLLNFLDGYPINLPARYTNKVACYEYVYIISNLELREQYIYERLNQPEIWAAFIRRIHTVIHFIPDGSKREYNTIEYLNSSDLWKELPNDTPTPFDGELQTSEREKSQAELNEA